MLFHVSWEEPHSILYVSRSFHIVAENLHDTAMLTLSLHFDHIHSFHLNHRRHMIHHIFCSLFALPWPVVMAPCAPPKHNPSCLVHVPPSSRLSSWSRLFDPLFILVSCLPLQGLVRITTLTTPCSPFKCMSTTRSLCDQTSCFLLYPPSTS